MTRETIDYYPITANMGEDDMCAVYRAADTKFRGDVSIDYRDLMPRFEHILVQLLRRSAMAYPGAGRFSP